MKRVGKAVKKTNASQRSVTQLQVTTRDPSVFGNRREVANGGQSCLEKEMI